MQRYDIGGIVNIITVMGNISANTASEAGTVSIGRTILYPKGVSLIANNVAKMKAIMEYFRYVKAWVHSSEKCIHTASDVDLTVDKK